MEKLPCFRTLFDFFRSLFSQKVNSVSQFFQSTTNIMDTIIQSWLSKKNMRIENAKIRSLGLLNSENLLIIRIWHSRFSLCPLQLFSVASKRKLVLSLWNKCIYLLDSQLTISRRKCHLNWSIFSRKCVLRFHPL